MVSHTRTIAFWILGALCILFGSMIGSQASPDVVGATDVSYVIALIVAFILVLVGGLLWISVAGLISEE
ncbi:MAG: hypothetical protein ABEK36_02695 [Candidatus Aenigmatarchaeota archaeon]